MATSSEGPAAQQLKAAILGSGKQVGRAALRRSRANAAPRPARMAPTYVPPLLPSHAVATRQVIHSAVAEFVKELRAGGPMRGSGTAQPKAAPAKPAAAVAANGAAAAAAQQKDGGAAAAAEKTDGKEKEGGRSGHSINITERFFAGAAGALPAQALRRLGGPPGAAPAARWALTPSLPAGAAQPPPPNCRRL